MQVRSRTWRCHRCFTFLGLPLRLLLRGLSSVRALSRAGGCAKPGRRNGHLPNAARAHKAHRRYGSNTLPACVRQSPPLVCRLLPHPDCQHRRRPALSSRWRDSFIHGPRSRWPFSRSSARTTALLHLRTLGHRTAAAGRTPSAVASSLRPPHFNVPWMVATRARASDTVLRRSYAGSARRATRAREERARCPLNLAGLSASHPTRPAQ